MDKISIAFAIYRGKNLLVESPEGHNVIETHYFTMEGQLNLQ